MVFETLYFVSLVIVCYLEIADVDCIFSPFCFSSIFIINVNLRNWYFTRPLAWTCNCTFLSLVRPSVSDIRTCCTVWTSSGNRDTSQYCLYILYNKPLSTFYTYSYITINIHIQRIRMHTCYDRSLCARTFNIYLLWQNSWITLIGTVIFFGIFTSKRLPEWNLIFWEKTWRKI